MESLDSAVDAAGWLRNEAQSLLLRADATKQKLESVRSRRHELKKRLASLDALAVRLREAELEVEVVNLEIARRSLAESMSKISELHAGLEGAIVIAPVLQCSPE
jgi:hypothetical protein